MAGSWLYTTNSQNRCKGIRKQALGMFLVGTNQMEAGNISRTRQKNRNKLAYVMAGGDLSEYLSEQFIGS
jgi:3-hydroxyacyl-CoA dehydrogenase